MAKEQVEYVYEGSLVSGRQLWEVPHEQVYAEALASLPQMYAEVFHWMSRRPTLSAVQLVKLYGQTDIPFHSGIHDARRGFIAAARREAREFACAALFDGAPEEKIQDELGDTLFFLLTQTINYGLKDNAEDWFIQVQFDAPGPVQHELVNQPGEKVVESVVAMVDETLGHGSSGIVFQHESFGRSLSRAYAVIFRYAISAGWNLDEILKRIRFKNDYNYPDLLFIPPYSPFPYYQDAIDFLRMFRLANSPRGKTYLEDLHERFGESISWADHTVKAKEFQTWIVSCLEEIVKTNMEEPFRRLAKSLLFDWRPATRG